MAQKWYQSVGVRSAIILVIGSIIVAGMYIWNDRSELTQSNKKYKAEIEKKNSHIDDLKQRLSQKHVEIQRLETQLVPSKIVNLKNQSVASAIAKMTQLGNLAVWENKYGGQRESYEDLLSWWKKENDSEIKKRILAEIERLEEIYDPRIMVPTIEKHFAICKLHSGCKEIEPPTDYDAKNVFHHLTERIWTERARAACLLRNIRTSKNKDQINKEELFDKLIERLDLSKEKSLFVAKMSFETYKELSNFSSPGIFDFEKAIEDWEKPERKEDILKMNL